MPEKLNSNFARKYQSGESSVVLFNAQKASENAQSLGNLPEPMGIHGTQFDQGAELESYIQLHRLKDGETGSD